MNNELYHYGVPGMKWGVRRKLKTAINNRRRNKLVSEHDKEADEFKIKTAKYETRLNELKNEARYMKDTVYKTNKEILEDAIQAHREGEKAHRTCSNILSKISKEKMSSMTRKDFDRYEKICRSKLNKITIKYRLEDDFSSEDLWMLED